MISRTLFAVVDTAAPWCIFEPEVGSLLRQRLSPSQEHAVLSSRFGTLRGSLYRVPIALIAEEGESLEVEGTVFLSPDWPGPNFIGYQGLLQRIRFAVDPETNLFYFGPSEGFAHLIYDRTQERLSLEAPEPRGGAERCQVIIKGGPENRMNPTSLNHAQQMEPDERAVRELHSVWIDAVNAGDLARLLTLMADDVVFLSPGQAPFGQDGFSAGFSAAHRQARIHCISELEEVVVVGDVAYTRSRDSLSVTPVDSEEARLAGHRITIYRKQPDGRWVLARDAHTLSPAEKHGS